MPSCKPMYYTIRQDQKCAFEVAMKHLLGQTEYWRFPIMGEETWTGVEEDKSSIFRLSHFHLSRRQHHESSTQQI